VPTLYPHEPALDPPHAWVFDANVAKAKESCELIEKSVNREAEELDRVEGQEPFNEF
jgi:hypothetical protein